MKIAVIVLGLMVGILAAVVHHQDGQIRYLERLTDSMRRDGEALTRAIRQTATRTADVYDRERLSGQ